MTPLPEPHGRLLGGRYELQARIDQGGLGIIYRARDRQTGRVVAIKRLSAPVADDPTAIRRLEREARVTASLTSPHVVQVLDFGVEDAHPYLVMEYLPGGALASHVAGQLPLPAEQIVAYGRQIAAGLAAAHARGLVHRDVTLRNILVAPDGRLKVADFGIAKAPGDTALTQTGVALGTAIAMAPEQVRGQAVTPATDVYGLGVLLYQLATGQPPFSGDTEVAVAVQHLQAEVRPPRQRNPALPAWLERVILRALAKDPAARYPDAAAIGAALAGGASGRPGLVIMVPRVSGRRAAVAGATRLVQRTAEAWARAAAAAPRQRAEAVRSAAGVVAASTTLARVRARAASHPGRLMAGGLLALLVTIGGPWALASGPGSPGPAGLTPRATVATGRAADGPAASVRDTPRPSVATLVLPTAVPSPTPTPALAPPLPAAQLATPEPPTPAPEPQASDLPVAPPLAPAVKVVMPVQQTPPQHVPAEKERARKAESGKDVERGPAKREPGKRAGAEKDSGKDRQRR